MKTDQYYKSLEQKNTKELAKELKNQYANLQKSRFMVKFRNLKDVSQIKKTKKNIARIHTVLSKKNS